MEQQAILALGTITLLGCGAGLVFIHSSNPLLKGLNWMGSALLVGGLGAALLLCSLTWPSVQPVANLCILLAFVCNDRADQYLLGHPVQLRTLGKTLLVLEIGIAPLQWLHLIGTRGPILVLSLLLAVQVTSTARTLRRDPSSGDGLPARFTAGLMHFIVAANLVRGALAAGGLFQSARAVYVSATLTDSLIVASAIGLSFCFFWRATARLTAELEHMASTDPLTRVYNRRVFLKWCDKELERSRISGVPFSVLLMDFDHFKRVNDTFGHHIGDEVLCAAVERIQDSVRGLDVLCRWGGEEFAVLLPNASPEATRIVAERVRQNVRLINGKWPRFVNLVPKDFQLSVSIGAATYANEDDQVESMLQRADTALYQAKDAGRDRVVFASPYTPLHHEPELNAELGLESNQLVETLP